jgi:hypothetical protein
MGRFNSLVVAAILGLSTIGRADDRSVDAPKKADGSGILGGIYPLSAGNLMADEPLPPPTAMPINEPPKAPAPQDWTIKGFAEIAYTWNTNHPETTAGTAGGVPREPKENSLRVFDVNANEFMLHNVTLDVEKAATESNWVGFRAVVMAGQDAKWIHSAGLFDGGTGAVSGAGEDIDMPDAYVTIKIPKSAVPFGTTFTIGKKETTHGYEVISSGANINYSRSMLFGFAIPFTHTGIMADTAWVENSEGGEIFGTGMGVVNGWDNVKDNNNAKGFMGQLRLTPCSFFKTNAEAIFSPEQPNDNSNWRGLVDINATLTPIEGFDIGGNYDYGYEENAVFLTSNAGYSTWYGFAGYVKYRFTKSECLKKWYLGFRGEWFNDPDGIRVGTSTVTGPGGTTFVRNGNDYIGLTTTIGYQPLESLLLRLEHRWDKSDQDVYNENGGTFRNYQNTIALDLVVFY